MTAETQTTLALNVGASDLDLGGWRRPANLCFQNFSKIRTELAKTSDYAQG
jgi:hypothetical protein